MCNWKSIDDVDAMRNLNFDEEVNLDIYKYSKDILFKGREFAKREYFECSYMSYSIGYFVIKDLDKKEIDVAFYDQSKDFIAEQWSEIQ